MAGIQMSACSICKGRKLLCKRNTCPKLQKLNVMNKIKKDLEKIINKKDIFGASPPSVFVGEYNYPKVRVCPQVPPLEGDTSFLDDPLKWENRSMDAIIKYRAMLIMGESNNINVNLNKYPSNKIIENIQELSLSIKPVDSEIILKNKPKFDIVQNSFSPPIAPKGNLLLFKISENPKIPKKSDYVVNDELKATEGIIKLYNYGFSEYYIIKLMSCGLLGINKKLVPTRWSITAVQDTIGKYLIKKIINYPFISNYEVYFSEFLGNRYAILIIPDYYSYELMEIWESGSLFGSDTPTVLGDYENLKKKGYAKETTGAFYAARLSILEYLNKRRKQGKIIVFREITKEYHTPLGVWQIRSGVKKALSNKKLQFDTLKECLKEIDKFLNNPIDLYLSKSKLLKKDRQSRLEEYI